MTFSATRLGRLVGRLALGICLALAIGIPGGYFHIATSRLDHDLRFLGELKASRLSKYIYIHRDLWQYHRIRLAEQMEIAEADEEGMRQRLFETNGEPVLETGVEPASPVHSVRVPVLVAGAPIGTIEIAASLRPILIQTALVAALSLPLGLAIFLIIRILLLRTLDRTFTELEESRSHYRHVLDSTLDAVFTTDPQGITYVSPAAERVLGLPPGDIVGTSPKLLFHPDDVPRMMAALRASHRAPGTVQALRIRAAGTLRHGQWLELRFKTTGAPNAEGFYNLIGVVRDIDAQVQMERAQRDDMLKLRSIVESSGALIALVDARQRIVLANRSFLETVGKPQDEVVGRRYRDVVDCGAEAPALDAWFAGKQHETLTFDQLIDAPGRRRVVRVSASRVDDEDRDLNYSLFLGVDETERRSAEGRALDAARLATLGEMATGIAHEINQPLTVVQFGVEAVEADLEDGLHRDDPDGYAQDALRHLARVRDQVQRASAIVRRLQGFARAGEDAVQTFDIAETVAGATDLVGEQMRLARIAVELDLPAGLPAVRGHANRLQQVIVNLLINARDAINEERARTGGRALPARVEIRAARTAQGWVQVDIADSGPGIPEHVLPRLFESFFTTKPAGKGTGLGLSISREILGEMGGTIVAANREGGGAVFRIGLPPADASLHQAA